MCSSPRTSDRKYSWVASRTAGSVRSMYNGSRSANGSRSPRSVTVAARPSPKAASIRAYPSAGPSRARSAFVSPGAIWGLFPGIGASTRGRRLSGVRRRVPARNRRGVDDRGRRLAVEQKPVEHLGEVLDRREVELDVEAVLAGDPVALGDLRDL